MKQFENKDLEFKEIYVADIKKEVIAFANSEGGVLYVGIRKDGTVAGVEDPDDVMLKIAGSLKDSIRPDVMPFVKICAVQKEEKTVVEVLVETGTNRPYYLQEKGLKPTGVYVRKGSSSQPLSDEGIREMIVAVSGTSYENCRSMNQNLTFETLQEEMQKRNLDLGPAQMRTLHLMGEDGLYTNLALLLSDQCEHTIKAAVFQGSDKAVFRDRKEFSGSILKQLNEAFQLIDLLNKTQATFTGLNRIDKRDYPVEAVREALLNCIDHRDYSFSGSTLLNFYDDRLEFVSLGGLVSGISMEAIFMGVSQSRNTNLAAMFYRMNLIESYGTGIGKICRMYENEQCQPQFDTAKGVFRVILPNCNEKKTAIYKEVPETSLVKENRALYYAEKSRQTQYNPAEQGYDEEEQVLMLARERGKIKRKEVEQLLGVKQTKAFYLLQELCEKQLLISVGKGRSSYYVPTKRM